MCLPLYVCLSISLSPSLSVLSISIHLIHLHLPNHKQQTLCCLVELIFPTVIYRTITNTTNKPLKQRIILHLHHHHHTPPPPPSPAAALPGCSHLIGQYFNLHLHLPSAPSRDSPPPPPLFPSLFQPLSPLTWMSTSPRPVGGGGGH